MTYSPKDTVQITNLDDVRRFEATPLAERNLPASTYQAIEQAATHYGDRTALTFLAAGTAEETPIELSFRQLFARITQTANAFHALGVESQSVVSMMLPNLPQSHFTIWGAEAAGIFNPINPLLDVEHVAGILREANTRVLVTLAPTPGSDLWDKALAVREQVPSLRYLVAVNVTGDAADASYLSETVLDFDQLIAAQPADRLLSGRQIQPTDIASYFHTGGTTGTPKLAPHTHFNEVSCSYLMGAIVELNDASRCLCGLPLFHVNGVFVTGLAPWMRGAQVILATAAGYRTPAVLTNFWHLVEKYQVTFFSCVPTILSALLEVPTDGHDLSSLDAALCGAAPLATELMRRFEAKTGIVLLEGYGQTEGTCATSCNPKFGDRRVGSVGLPMPYTGIRIVEVDDDGRWIRDCDTNESGCVAISGPNVFAGYKQPDQNDGQWVEEGWFNTGDLGRLDEDGYLWLTGRSKDLIIRGGHNIDPQMIEEAYYQHPDVAEAVAVGKPDRRVGELPVLFVQLKPGARVSAEELLAHGRETIHERAAVPKEVLFVDQVPLTAVGKIFKPELRHQLVADLVRQELAELPHPIAVEVTADKKFGQCVHITAPETIHEQIRTLLADFGFRLELSQ
ncbi:acyl-CoA synthetase [Marinobacter xestospongiae]|uniref:acyl-CoA synthetase n=1 Tax=Marinobacter xestospongiae TaxID=994319 RepID=UPI00200638A4|nr:acyl-CoA synthetase [Marinobacter xestospongiae]MCK7565432.1 acyl-CoA synthetase [Marinobacter xestospongiae]